ncbi:MULTISPECIES: diacylglycerol/polyprenol kinase family protein [unclassified Haladaptatus]|uniref:diacylglycerol/polyprenol kinase family protein n=1 Tax=unclassified Haladaptatus TaxID=2622732 RepID=UPI0023E77E14|nr:MULTISPECIES: dolichol kinase [unclassified Haladaptatus]
MDDEIERRLVHVSGILAPLSYWVGVFTWEQLGYALIAGSVVVLALEVIRLVVGLDWKIYDELTREYEQDNLAGYALYVWGVTFVALVFDPDIAIPAMLMLSIGDPISGVLGSGELRAAKQAYVLLAMFGVTLFIGVWFVPVLVAVLGAIAATVADGVKPVIAGYVIDDNLTIPIGAAVTMYVAITYLPEPIQHLTFLPW